MRTGLSISAAAVALLGCSADPQQHYADVLMLDCRMRTLGWIHVHKNMNETKATVFTRYQHNADNHNLAIRNARASSGTLRLSQESRNRSPGAADAAEPAGADAQVRIQPVAATREQAKAVEVELFLKGDDFGEKPKETVVFRFSEDRRDVRVIGISYPGMGWGLGQERTLDEGVCHKDPGS